MLAKRALELADRDGGYELQRMNQPNHASRSPAPGRPVAGKRGGSFAKPKAHAVGTAGAAVPAARLAPAATGTVTCCLAAAEPENGSGDSEGSRYREACKEVRERATQALQVANSNGWVLEFALDHLSLGRASLGLAVTTPRGFDEATEHLDRAVDGLRQAGAEEFIARGFLARAALHRLRVAQADDDATAHLQAAKADLREAAQIAERGHMRLHQADVHLELTRLRLQTGDVNEARRELEQASELVTECGYGCRGREVTWLTSQVGDTSSK